MIQFHRLRDLPFHPLYPPFRAPSTGVWMVLGTEGCESHQETGLWQCRMQRKASRCRLKFANHLTFHKNRPTYPGETMRSQEPLKAEVSMGQSELHETVPGFDINCRFGCGRVTCQRLGPQSHDHKEEVNSGDNINAFGNSILSPSLQKRIWS